jgi:hypothetical protein
MKGIQIEIWFGLRWILGVCGEDWRSAGYTERGHTSLNYCERAHPSVVDVWLGTTTWIKSDLDTDDQSSAAKSSPENILDQGDEK